MLIFIFIFIFGINLREGCGFLGDLEQEFRIVVLEFEGLQISVVIWVLGYVRFVGNSCFIFFISGVSGLYRFGTVVQEYVIESFRNGEIEVIVFYWINVC